MVPVAIKNSDLLMGKGTGEARSGILEMVILQPVSTEALQTDEDINRLVSRVRAAVAVELDAPPDN